MTVHRLNLIPPVGPGTGMGKQVGKKPIPQLGEEVGPSLHSACWRFGDFEVDETKRELRCKGEALEIEPKPFNMLLLLLRHPGELVTKNDLLDALWTGRFVTESVLTNCAGKLRAVLADEDQKLLKTIHGYGYRFDAAVELISDDKEPEAPPQLTFNPGDRPPLRPNWRLVRRLGKSGESWLAEHEKTRQKRVFKFAADPRALSSLKREVTIYRLLRESLAHRISFVELLDWNFDEPPWFIEIEYCPCGSLQEWFESQGGVQKVALPQRLELVAQIADALADVHSLGVLHKDLKPANVLVVADDNDQLKIRLADFGSGHLMDPERLSKLQITRLGFTQTIDSNALTSGTPLYYAPEVLLGQPATAKADIYALGVILYQCIVGNLRRQLAPGWEFEVDNELLREDIAHASDGDPERRLADASELARNLRRLEARRLEKESERAAKLRAEQEAKALERLRARRFGLQIAFAAMAVGLVVSTTLYFRTKQAEQRAQAEAQHAQAVNEFLVKDLLQRVDSGDQPVKDLTVKALLDSAAARIDQRFADQPRIRAELHSAIGKSYVALDLTEPALSELTRSWQWYRSDGYRSEEAALQVAAEIVPLDYRAGTTKKDLTTFIAELQEAENTLGSDDSGILQLRREIGRAEVQMGEWRAGEEMLNKALNDARKSSATNPVVIAQLERSIGIAQFRSAKFADALRTLNRATNDFGQAMGQRHLEVGVLHIIMANVECERGNGPAAQAELDRATVIVNDWEKSTQSNMVGIHLVEACIAQLGQVPDQAIRILNGVLPDLAPKAGEIDQSYTAEEPLSLSLQVSGRLEEAEQAARKALGSAEAALGSDHPWVRRIHVELADILRERHDLKAAVEQLTHSGKMLAVDDLPPNHPIRADLLRVRGLIAADSGAALDARSDLQEALNSDLSVYGATHWRVRRDQASLSSIETITAKVSN